MNEPLVTRIAMWFRARWLAHQTTDYLREVADERERQLRFWMTGT